MKSRVTTQRTAPPRTGRAISSGNCATPGWRDRLAAVWAHLGGTGGEDAAGVEIEATALSRVDDIARTSGVSRGDALVSLVRRSLETCEDGETQAERVFELLAQAGVLVADAIELIARIRLGAPGVPAALGGQLGPAELVRREGEEVPRAENAAADERRTVRQVLNAVATGLYFGLHAAMVPADFDFSRASDQTREHEAYALARIAFRALTGHSITILDEPFGECVPMDAEGLAGLDAYADAHQLTRAEALRDLAEAALAEEAAVQEATVAGKGPT